MHRGSSGNIPAHDFLAVEHNDIGFLINRDQFFASMYLEKMDAFPGAEGPPDYCIGTMVFRQETLLVYNLDTRLGDLFSTGEQEGLKIALISDINVFSAKNRQKFLKTVGKAAPDASREMIAFRIGSLAEIKSIPLPQVRLVPGRLRAFLGDRGILGCRFSGAKDIYFMVDIETITFGGITEE